MNQPRSHESTDGSPWTDAVLERLEQRWLRCRQVLRKYGSGVTEPSLLVQRSERLGGGFEPVALGSGVVVTVGGEVVRATPGDAASEGLACRMERLESGRYRATALGVGDRMQINERVVTERVLVSGDWLEVGGVEFLYYDGPAT